MCTNLPGRKSNVLSALGTFRTESWIALDLGESFLAQDLPFTPSSPTLDAMVAVLQARLVTPWRLGSREHGISKSSAKAMQQCMQKESSGEP